MSHAPITPVSTYINIFVSLLVLTAATYLVARYDFGLLNTPIALAVAILKASLVVIYFMGVRYNTPLTKVFVVSGFFWLVIMFGLTLNDYLTRGWLGVAGR